MVASSLRDKALSGMSVYNASKAAVRSLVKTFAVELLPRDIRVNTLSPGPVDTPIIETVAKTPAEAVAFREYAANLVPMKRLGRPDEVAAARCSWHLARAASRRARNCRSMADTLSCKLGAKLSGLRFDSRPFPKRKRQREGQAFPIRNG